jgi:heat shock protein 5
MAPVDVAGLHTSAAVPPLLAAFYLVLGWLHILADDALQGEQATQQARQRALDPLWVAASFGAPARPAPGTRCKAAPARAACRPWTGALARGWPAGLLLPAAGVLAADLEASAWMYERGLPYWQISAVLAALAAATWRAFDGTRQGAALAALCAVGAPAAELVLLQLLPLWHYSRPDVLQEVLGFVSWVPWCYFFYTPRCGRGGAAVQQQAAGPRGAVPAAARVCRRAACRPPRLPSQRGQPGAPPVRHAAAAAAARGRVAA